MKGSITVEAAYIVPCCIFILGILCYLGIFVYNQAVLKMTGYEHILHAIEEGVSEEHVFQETLMKKTKETANERTLGVKDLEVIVKMTATKISVSFEGMQNALGVPLEVTSVYERIYPETTLRLRVGKGRMSDGGSVEERTQ